MTRRTKLPKILAINPGMRELGFAVIDDWARLRDFGVKNFKHQKDPVIRIQKYREFIRGILSLENVTDLVIEKIPKQQIFQRKNYTFLPLLVEGIKSEAILQKIPVRELEMIFVKRYICGKRKPIKENMAQVLVYNHFPYLERFLNPESEWEAKYRYKMFDAIGLGLTYFYAYTR